VTKEASSCHPEWRQYSLSLHRSVGHPEFFPAYVERVDCLRKERLQMVHTGRYSDMVGMGMAGAGRNYGPNNDSAAGSMGRGDSCCITSAGVTCSCNWEVVIRSIL